MTNKTRMKTPQIVVFNELTMTLAFDFDSRRPLLYSFPSEFCPEKFA